MKKFLIILLMIVISLLTYFLAKEDKPIGVVVEKEDDISIVYPKDLEEVNEIVNITGKANKNFKFVEAQIDLNGWRKASGVINWNYLLNSSNLEPGIHVIYARASDGIKYSKTKAVRIKKT
jgi:hypothetical protein